MDFAFKTSLALTLAAAALLACSSSSKSGSSGADDDDDASGSGVDLDADLAAKDLKDLDDDDKQALCEALNAAAKSAGSDSSDYCLLAGAQAGAKDAEDHEGACEDAIASCEKTLAKAKDAIDCDAFVANDLSDCDGTAQDVADCYGDQLAATTSFFSDAAKDAPACKDIDDDTEAPEVDLSTIDTPKSCAALAKSCKAVSFGGTSSGDDDDTSGDDDTVSTEDSGTTKVDAAPPLTGCIKCSGTVTCTMGDQQLQPGTLSGTGEKCTVTGSTDQPYVLVCPGSVQTTGGQAIPGASFTSTGPASSEYDVTLPAADGTATLHCAP